MAINNASIPVGATFAPTGGTARTILVLDAASPRGVVAMIDEGLAFQAKKSLTFQSSDPKADVTKPGGFGPRKCGYTLLIPKLCADGKWFLNKFVVTGDVHPETTPAETAVARSIQTSLLNDADFTSSWDTGAKA